MPQQEDVLSIQEAARLLSLDPMSVRRMVAAGRLKAFKNDATKRVYVRRADVDAEKVRRSSLVPIGSARAQTVMPLDTHPKRRKSKGK